jgi:hypothetical protein
VNAGIICMMEAGGATSGYRGGGGSAEFRLQPRHLPFQTLSEDEVVSSDDFYLSFLRCSY